MTDPYARYTRLKFDRPHPKVLRITMENGRMNTTDAALHAELGDIWRDIDRDASVNAVVLTGAGKVFSAGGDFAIIQENIDEFASRARQWKEARDIVYNVINCSKPVVSAMRGVAVGAGLVCGLLADISIATKDCRIIDGHTRLGVAAGDHAAIVWPLLCGLAKAKYYLLLCDQVLGDEAERIGLISIAVEDAELGREGGGDCHPPRRGRAECDPLDQIRIEQLAAGDGADLRYVAGARISRLYGTGGQGRARLAPREAATSFPAQYAALNAPHPDPLPACGRAVRGSRGVNLFVAVACPARRRFSVYFLVCETQKEDGACASHLPFSVSFWNRSGGVSSTRW